MDVGTTSSGRFRSRYLREMKAQRENPFHSPPSSTGSHGTVSPTRTSIFSGESTRRLNAEIDRAMAPAKFEVNWDAAHRKWPEFYSAPNANNALAPAPVIDSNNSSSSVKVATLDRHAENLRRALAEAHIYDSEDDTTGHGLDAELDLDGDESTRDGTWMGSSRTRAEMQPRVDDTDASSMLVRSPLRMAGLAGFNGGRRRRSSLSVSLAQQQPPQPARSASDPQLRQARVSLAPAALPSSLNPARAKKNPLASAASLSRPSPAAAILDSPGHNMSANLTSRSFMMPDISHLGEFISGSLQYKGNNSNGVPIFVKHGRVHDRNDTRLDRHSDVDAMQIPDDEDKIFVSMDQIREQIIGLQEHDDMVQQYADSLEHEVERLKTEVQDLKYTRANDSGLGSALEGDHGGQPNGAAPNPASERLVSENARLENQVRTLQARLDEAAHKASASEANTVHLAQEHSRIIKRFEAACSEMNEYIEKHDSMKKQLAATQQELEASQQLNLGKNTSSEAALRREIDSLKKDNKRLEAEVRALKTELKTLRTDEDLTRKNHERLLTENQSLRATNRNLLRETQDLRSEKESGATSNTAVPVDVQSLRVSNRALMKEADELRENMDAARQEIIVLQQDVARLDSEQHALRGDNESLVRHNDKYFTENKILRKENSSYERTLHQLHDDNLRLKEEVDFLKNQLDHCRPVDKEADLTGAAEDFDEGLTSGFLVPDASMTNDGFENAAGGDATSHSTRQMPDATDHSTRNFTGERSNATPEQSRQVKRGGGNTSQKVAFSIPDNSTDGGTPARPANVGSKRRSVSGVPLNSSRKAKGEVDGGDDTTGRSTEPSQDMTSRSGRRERNKERESKDYKERESKGRDRERDIEERIRDIKEKARESKIKDGKVARDLTVTRDLTSQSTRQGTSSKRSSARPRERTADLTRDRTADLSRDSIPALSASARRVLDNLCEHNCRNCTVCARISSHRTATAADIAAGKKRVVVQRPVPVTERDVTSSTVRPSTDPSRALALVIKGLTDERDHINMRLAQLQEQYSLTDPSVGRRARAALAEQIRYAMASAEAKSDQIYHLNDVVVGLGQDGDMDEDEMELTVFSITGAHVAEWMDQVTS